MADFHDSIDIAAAPETVFEYLTTDVGLTAWMGQYAELEPTPGGEFSVDIAGHAIRGEYLHVESPRRVVVSWGMAGSEVLPPGASTVEFVLTPTGSGTRVDLTHSDLPETEVRGHAYGWAHFLPRLAVAGAGGDAGSDDWRPSTIDVDTTTERRNIKHQGAPHGTGIGVRHRAALPPRVDRR